MVHRDVKADNIMLARPSGWEVKLVDFGNCTQGGKLFLQRGNVDRDTGSCCSGIRLHGTNDCFDYFDQSGPHPYSCDVMGRNMNQQYRLLEDGRLQKGDGDCVVSRSGGSLFLLPGLCVS
eukprot:s3466_g6.t2